MVKEIANQSWHHVENDGSTWRTDPIVAAIDNLRAGMEDYDRHAPMETDEAARAYAAVSYAEPLKIIRGWKLPARSMQGAIAALRLAKKADEDGDYAIVGPMLAAALSYLED